ncbi:MAG: GH116 family glycosyl-hydrolase [Deltaproteobacteria bacterium]
MKKSSRSTNAKKAGRRRFLQTVALGAGGLALPAGAAASDERADKSKTVPEAASISEYPRTYSGRQLAMISFPLGGIGAGSVGLGGRGQLRDWEIFNRAQKGNALHYSFPAIWVRAGKRKPITRVLEARYLPPYEGASGLGSDNVPGLPRLETCTFTGEFPFAQIDFHDSSLPVAIQLEAFTPFIPLAADDSGLPVAVLRYRVKNRATTSATVSIAWSLENPVGKDVKGDGAAGRTNEYRKGTAVEGLLMSNPFLAASDPLAGTFALGILNSSGARVSHLRGWPRAGWWESPLLFWDDFSSDGELGPEHSARSAVGALCMQREIAAGAEAEFTFLLAWRFPNRTPERCGWSAPKGHEHDLIGNHYCARFPDAWQAAEYAAANLTNLESRSRQFVAAIRDTALPAAVRDAAVANLSTLVSPTCFRTFEGEFHGFEGCNDEGGCCFGSCTHVWNYEATVPSVFPGLSRSLRGRQFGYSTDDEGRMSFRELLPSGIDRWGHAAADGQMGAIIKLFWDWKNCGDNDWLGKLWPAAKRALEFAWIAGGWDANRDGVMEGVQHNTYDVEFYGPNPLCAVWYLGALRAGEEMARACGDTEFAAECHRLFNQGSQWIDANLFNGEYYIQKIKSSKNEAVAKGLQAGMGSASTESPTYQLGDGCLVDQLVGQYLCEVAGLGLLLDAKNTETALRSIYKYNYKPSLADHESMARTYALNDEAALVICDYARGTRPETPFPYFAEAWTGLEYSTAALMIYHGMVREGVQIYESARKRFDGEKRNPWDEPECGHHYARAMSAWAGMLALSGFRYDAERKHAIAQPRINAARFSSIWTAGPAWGTFAQSAGAKGQSFELKVVEGELSLRSLALATVSGPAKTSSASLGGQAVLHELTRGGNKVILSFKDEIVVKRGASLKVTV